MRTAADDLDYERAAELRDRIRGLEEDALLSGFEAPAKTGNDPASRKRGGRGGPRGRARR